jgi:PAS domain S-box-containing protein
MTAPDISRLERRLVRERAARKQAETLLEEKSLELYRSNQELAGAVSALEASSSRLSAILDHSFAGTLVSDEQNQVIVINHAAKVMFRQNETNVIGTSILDLLVKDERSRLEDATTSSIGTDDEEGSEVWHEAKGQRPDGSTFPLEFIVTNLELSETRHRVWIFRDLTQQIVAETERQALEETLRQAQKLEALGTMAGGVAHEINTPIQYIGDNINYLRDGMEDVVSVLQAYQGLAKQVAAGGDATAALERVRNLESEADLEFLMDEIPGAISQANEGLARVSKIVQAVKQFAHPGSQEQQAFDVNQAIASTVEVASGQWKYVAELEADYGGHLPQITGHLGEFNQIILNLIVNAAQAIEESGKSDGGLIQIRTACAGDTLSITISDNGCGIPKAIQDRIFEPFFTTKDVGKGTGQGLALCYRIMTQGFNGSIDVASEEGKGTTFSLKFPIQTGVVEEREVLAV